LKGCKKHYIPKTAEDKRGKLSDTKITDFSSIIAYKIFKNWSAVKADKNIGANQFTSASYYSLKLYGILWVI
jgi:hypothetical protein